MMDIVLVNPSDQRVIYQQLAGSYTACETPIWAGMLAAFLRRRGLAVDIADPTVLGQDAATVAREIVDRKPRLIALVCYGQQPSASTFVMPGARAIARHCKELAPETPVIMVGGHVAALPERTLEEEPADYVCDGEGPYTLLELALALREKSPDLSKVRGLLYRDKEGRVHHTPPAPLVMDLDGEMPDVAWDLLPMDRYTAHNWHCFDHLDARRPYASLYTTLGCPFHCTFCCIQAPFRQGERACGLKPTHNSYRLWSPEKTLASIDTLVQRYGIRNLKLSDELFVWDKEHVRGICQGIIDRGYDLNIWAYARVNGWDQEELDLMRRAGLRWLAVGFESGNERVLKSVHKGYQQEQAHSVVAAFRQAGIRTLGNFIFGLPEDDLDSMRDTYNLARNLRCDFLSFYSAMAYPGSHLYEQALEEKWPLPDDWSGYSQYARNALPLPTRYLSGEEVLAFRDQAFHDYFSDPVVLGDLERAFSPEVRRYMEKMIKVRLPRDHTPAAATVQSPNDGKE